MTKKELRKEIKYLRDSLDDGYILEASRSITEKVIASNAFHNSQTIFTYISTLREPDTSEIITEARRLGKKILVPLCLAKPDMLAVDLDNQTEQTAADKADIDLVIVPCMSANSDGTRLGHGGGYYDKFLEDYKGETLCLCFSKLMRDDIPQEEHDIKVKVINET